jgi:hypothetical protein
MLQRWALAAKEALSSLTAQDPKMLFLKDHRDVENKGQPQLPPEDYYAVSEMSARERIDAIHAQVRRSHGNPFSFIDVAFPSSSKGTEDVQSGSLVGATKLWHVNADVSIQ